MSHLLFFPMAIFSKKTIKTDFSTRREAFNWMLSYLIEDKGMEPLDAAKQAEEFAQIVAANNGLPQQTAPEPKGMDRYINEVKKVVVMVKENPEIIEYGVPLVSFITGLFTGKKEASTSTNPDQVTYTQEQPTQEPIDFDKIP